MTRCPANPDPSRDCGKSEGSINQKDPSSPTGPGKKSCQTRVHSFSEAILCGGIGCKVAFVPIRKDQVFCSPDCKSKYFTLARKLGDVLLKAHGVEVNSIEGEPEAYEAKFNGQVIYLGKEARYMKANKEGVSEGRNLLPQFITEKELLARFGLTENQLRYLRSDKGLPYLNLTKRTRLYRESDLMKFLEKSAASPKEK